MKSRFLTLLFSIVLFGTAFATDGEKTSIKETKLVGIEVFTSLKHYKHDSDSLWNFFKKNDFGPYLEDAKDSDKVYAYLIFGEEYEKDFPIQVILGYEVTKFDKVPKEFKLTNMIIPAGDFTKEAVNGNKAADVFNTWDRLIKTEKIKTKGHEVIEIYEFDKSHKKVEKIDLLFGTK
ncbi:hypothetical protein FUAX_47680 (plasmid) [Fulvitalea axinellae]|uniref:Integron-associated effector binding protein domain-containing protein n=1 Tax=Fulvitalea axinellae TaxID=1182444 RepID=A0AAU9CJP4_9BACT|nr:hypothetical protein FUAX_47680 [Fulvitalea axinellae]